MSNINDTTGTSESRSGLTGRASDTLDQAKQKVAEQAHRAADTATQTAKSMAADLSNEASKVAGEAAERAKSFADENKGKVAEQIDSLGGVLNRAADELETNNQAMFAGYARQLASGVESVSTTLRDKGVDELFGMVGQFARRQPAVFIGGAALLGFIASRFAVASAKAARAGMDGQGDWANEGSQQDFGAQGGSSYGSTGYGATSGLGAVNDPAADAWDSPEGSQSGTGSAWEETESDTAEYGNGSSRPNGQWTSTRDTDGGTI